LQVVVRGVLLVCSDCAHQHPLGSSVDLRTHAGRGRLLRASALTSAMPIGPLIPSAPTPLTAPLSRILCTVTVYVHAAQPLTCCSSSQTLTVALSMLAFTGTGDTPGLCCRMPATSLASTAGSIALRAVAGWGAELFARHSRAHATAPLGTPLARLLPALRSWV